MSFAGEFIKKHREARNLSQKYVAAQLGFSNSFMAKVETGNCNLPMSYVSKLSRVLDVDKSELIKVMKKDYGVKAESAGA